MEKSIENTITGVHPYWVDNETQAVMELPEKVVLQSKRSISYQKITVLIVPAIFRKSRVKRHSGNTHRTISTPRT